MYSSSNSFEIIGLSSPVRVARLLISMSDYRCLKNGKMPIPGILKNGKTSISGILKREFFKMYLEDTGLFVTLCFMDKDVSDNIIYEYLVSGRLPANLGFVFENAVAQALIAAGYKAFYHTFLKDDGKHSYEVDFIIPSGERICPIEVKSSRINPHKSLDKFIEKYGKVIDIPIMISTKNIRMIGDILNIPIYMTGFLNRRRL